MTSDFSSPASDLRPPTSGLRGLRVCFIAGTLGQGGAERQLFYMASALKDAGAQVLVLGLTEGEVWESRLQAIGIPVKFIGASASRLKRLVAVFKAARAFRANIVQSQHFYTNGYSAITARLQSAYAIGAVRNDGFSDLQDCGRGFGPLCLHLPHCLAVNSRAAMRNLESLGYRREKLKHLPNVIDAKRFCPPASRNGNFLTILGIGRLVPQKRFDRFLRIVALINNQLPARPFKALIAGEGPLRRELELLARKFGLAPGLVEFCGNVMDVQLLYRRTHLLLVTSDHEGTPNVVMEAMASGLPVVATGVGDIADLVQHGTSGFVADPADEEGIARALANLLKNDGTREAMGICGRALIQSHHALDCLAGHLARLYSDQQI